MHNIYETLTRYDAVTNKVMPALASAWTSSADGTTWTFTLRAGVTFHTGRAMDAAAAKAAIERTKTLGQGAGYIWGAVKTDRGEGRPDARLHARLPRPARPDRLGATTRPTSTTREAAGAGAGEEALVAWFKTGKDAGTGPYTIASWKAGEEFELTLDKYAGYWGGWDGGALHEGRLPGRAGGDHRRAARPVRRRVVRRPADAAADREPEGQPRSAGRGDAVLPEPRRAPEHGLRPARRPQRPQGRGQGVRHQRDRLRARRLRGRQRRASSRGACSATATR